MEEKNRQIHNDSTRQYSAHGVPIIIVTDIIIPSLTFWTIRFKTGLPITPLLFNSILNFYPKYYGKKQILDVLTIRMEEIKLPLFLAELVICLETKKQNKTLRGVRIVGFNEGDHLKSVITFQWLSCILSTTHYKV